MINTESNIMITFAVFLIVLVVSGMYSALEDRTTKPGCALCEFVMKEMDNLLKPTVEPRTRADVEEALNNTCSLVPAILQTECNTFILTYRDFIVELVLKDGEPAQVCSKLGLCKK